MSDEPSDAQKLIAEVIATHRSLFDRGVTTHVRFASGWTVTE